jgi:hypothetical protein
MARSRNIKPGFFRNAELVELPVETRLLFIGLWTLADREGRLEDRPRQIKMELFPADQFDVGAMLDQLQSSGFLLRYEVDGKSFIEVSNFIKHQDPHYKEKASEYPPPPGKENFHKATGVTRTQRRRIMERDGFACKSCGCEDALCIDHVLPVSRGGDSSDENLQVLCMACNTRKGNKIGDEPKNIRQRRIEFGSNTVQQNRSLPSDSRSLIPDSRSLIPDSLNKIRDSAEGSASVNDAAQAQSPDPVPHKKIVELWRAHLPALIQPSKWTPSRASALRARWHEDPIRQSVDWWDKLFAHIAKIDFLCGRAPPMNGRKPFEIDIDWLLKQSNFLKVIEGKYDQ